jgi:hypothetical protein
LKKFVAIGLFFSLLCASFAARADDAEQATLAAKQVLKMVAENKLNALWDTLVAKQFKDQIGKDSFLANISQGRMSVGGPAESSQVVDVTYSNPQPETGYKTPFYACRFLTKYPAGKFYESFFMVKEADGQYRLAGVFSAPAPSN